MNNLRNVLSKVRLGVFCPTLLIVSAIVILGITDSSALIKVTKKGFDWILLNYGWAYQWAAMISLGLVAYIAFSKLGKIRIGGENAKPKYSFPAWFAMTLTGGIATGLIVYAGVNEPMVYYGNIYGELNKLGVKPFSDNARIFSMARNFYNWSFIPYAIYSISGLLMAFMYFNRKKPLKVSSSLIPILGEKVNSTGWSSLIDTLTLLALILGLASSMGGGLALLTSSLNTVYGIPESKIIMFILCVIITGTFTFCTYLGLDKGIKKIAVFNTWLFYFLLAFLFIFGPTVFILRSFTAGMATWLNNFWTWGLDPIDIGGSNLVMSWTLFDWSMWIAYAPLFGIFLAMISYGRTIKEFLIVNWVSPAIFGIIWISIWGGTAMNWQIGGKVDLVKIINENGFVAGLWGFLEKVPLIGFIVIPLVILALIVSFSTTADSMTITIASICSNKLKHGEEPAKWQKLLWGIFVGAISFLMIAYGGGLQGVDGIKYLAVIGGFVVFFIFILQLIAVVKVFIIDGGENEK